MPDALGGETPHTNDGGEAPQFLTAKDAEALVGKVVNAAITSHLKRLDIGKSVTEALAAQKARDAEEAAARAELQEPQEQVARSNTKVDPEVLALKRQLEAQKSAIDVERKKREEAEAARKSERVNNELRAALAKHVRPEAVEILTRAFRGDIQWDETGEPVMPLDEGRTITVAGWAENFAKQKDTAIFVPAPTAGGGGSPRSGSSPRPSLESLANKPRSQWNDADRAAYLAERTRANAAVGG
jgi:hypothetical protein